MPLRALFCRRPSEPQTFQVEFDQASFPVRVRRHRQARRYTLRIQAATREVILTMPPRGSLREAKEFAQKHGGLDRGAPAPPAAGRAVYRRHRPAAARRRASRRASARRARHGVDREADNGMPTAVSRATRRISGGGSAIICAARRARDLDTASRRAAEEFGVAIKRIAVRDQSSRWGSCSTTGVLSYSWRLILAPPFVLNYLAVHEVAHLSSR